MLEIFIPTQIKDYSNINNISNNFLNILKNSFENISVSNFSSSFFE
jgi:hypothetical protein